MKRDAWRVALAEIIIGAGIGATVGVWVFIAVWLWSVVF